MTLSPPRLRRGAFGAKALLLTKEETACAPLRRASRGGPDGARTTLLLSAAELAYSVCGMKKRPLHNRRELKATRQKLRNAMTPAEARLWTYLQKGQLAGRKFRRQHSVDRYVLDFYCPAEKLCVELDGESHAGPMAAAYDAERSAYLHTLGITVVRFENQVVWDMPDAMLEQIKANFRMGLEGE